MPNYYNIEYVTEKKDCVNAVIETPKGCRNKYSFDKDTRTFRLKKTLPEGMVFPYNFGFIPRTLAPDGDPADILVLMDEPVFTGCIAEVRIIGIINAEQIEKVETKPVENNRLLGITSETHMYKNINSIDDLGDEFIKELKNFFITYNEMDGKQFIPKSTFGVNNALKYIKKVNKAYKKEKH